MGEMVRTNPDTPCQPTGVHHPHRWECVDRDCDGWGVRCDYRPLDCCVCSQPWPCPERQRRDAAKLSDAVH
jgi:hypothetical protein